MENRPFLAARGTAAIITASGTGPITTRASSTTLLICFIPLSGSTPVSYIFISTSFPLIPPFAFISLAAYLALQDIYSPILAIGPVTLFKKGIVHFSTFTSF